MSDSRYQCLRHEMARFVPEQSQTLLEIGCGRGHLAENLKSRTGAGVLEYWAVEPEGGLAAEARARVDHLLEESVESALAGEKIPNSYFDCVLCNDVLEHLIDPEAAVRGLREKLKPGGILVSSIPNLRYFRALKELLFQKDLRYVEEGVFDRTHLRFFTSISIRRLFENAGLEIVRHEGINPTRSLEPRIWSALTLGLMRDTRFLQFATVARRPD